MHIPHSDPYIEALIQACRVPEAIPSWLAAQLDELVEAVSTQVTPYSYELAASALWVTYEAERVEVLLVGKLECVGCDVAAILVEMRLAFLASSEVIGGSRQANVELAWRTHQSFDFDAIEAEDRCARVAGSTVTLMSAQDQKWEMPWYQSPDVFKVLATGSAKEVSSVEDLQHWTREVTDNVLPNWAREQVAAAAYGPIATLAKEARAQVVSPAEVFAYLQARDIDDQLLCMVQQLSESFDQHLQAWGFALKYRVEDVINPLKLKVTGMRPEAQSVGSLVLGDETMGTIVLTAAVAWDSRRQVLERRLRLEVSMGKQVLGPWGFMFDRVHVTPHHLQVQEEPWASTFEVPADEWPAWVARRLETLEHRLTP